MNHYWVIYSVYIRKINNIPDNSFELLQVDILLKVEIQFGKLQ